jgi:MFS transporter, ACS family, hexuronate transporter
MSNVRWSTILTLLFTANLVNYLDRLALSITAPMVAKDLHLDPAQMGIIFSSFFIGYAAFNFIGGQLADRWGPRIVLGFAMMLWSLFCGLTGAVVGMVSILVVRVIFGVAEGPLTTVTNKTVNNWFPLAERGKAFGIANAGNTLGGALAGPIVGYAAVTYGWRPAFAIVALLGLIWTVFWMKFATNKPEENPRVGAAERTLIAAGRQSLEDSLHAPPLRHYLTSPRIWCIAIAFFGYIYVIYFFLTWFPSYLTSVHGLSVKSMSFTNVIPWVGGFLGLPLGGATSDFIARKTGQAVFARKLVIAVGLLVAALCVGLGGVVSDLVSAVVLMTVAVFFLQFASHGFWILIQDTVAPARVGAVGGFIHMLANIAGILGPAATGFIVQFTGSFSGAFFLAGGFALAGAIVISLGVRSPRVPFPVHATA